MKHPSLLLRSAIRPFIYKPAPTLELGHGVQLRSLSPQDASPLFTLIERNRAFLRHWISWIDLIPNLLACERFIYEVNYKDIFDGQWVYGIFDGEVLVGLLDFNEPKREIGQISIGYWLSVSAQGKGIVTRAVKACMDLIFTDLAVEKLLIKCASDNLSSQAVPQRLQFTWEGIQRDAGKVNSRTVDMHIFSMTPRDWFRIREDLAA